MGKESRYDRAISTEKSECGAGREKGEDRGTGRAERGNRDTWRGKEDDRGLGRARDLKDIRRSVGGDRNMERGKEYDWIGHKERSEERDRERERDERDKERRLRRDESDQRNERNEKDEDKEWRQRRDRTEIDERDEETRRRRDCRDDRDSRNERDDRDGRDMGKHWKQRRDKRSERDDMDRERTWRRDGWDKREDKGRRNVDKEGMRGRDERDGMDDRERERARRRDQRCERNERGKDMDWKKVKEEGSDRDKEREKEKEKKASRYERDDMDDGGDRDKDRRERRYERNGEDETDKGRGTRARRGEQELIGGSMDKVRIRHERSEKDEKVKKLEERQRRKDREGNEQSKDEEVEVRQPMAQVRQPMVAQEALGRGKLVDDKGRGRARREVANNVLDDPALDFFSPEFDALKALMTPGLQPPNPQAHPLDNLQKCKHLLPQEIKTDGDIAPCRPHRATDARSKESLQAQARAKAHQSSHAYLLAKKAAKQAKVLDAIADKMKGGPLEMLARCYSDKGRVQVWTRHAKGIRGSCIGFLEAVDKHMDMVLRDVDETYHVLTHVPRTVTVRVRVKPKPQPDAAEKDKANVPAQADLSPLPEQPEHELPICSIDDVCALWDSTEGKLGNSLLDSSMGCEKESGSGGEGDWEQVQEYERQKEGARSEAEGEKFSEIEVGEKEVEERTSHKRQQEGARDSRGGEEVTEDGPSKDDRSVRRTSKNEVEAEKDGSFGANKEDEVEVRTEQRVKYFRKLEHRRRHLKQVFIRGDSVVLIRVERWRTLCTVCRLAPRHGRCGAWYNSSAVKWQTSSSSLCTHISCCVNIKTEFDMQREAKGLASYAHGAIAQTTSWCCCWSYGGDSSLPYDDAALYSGEVRSDFVCRAGADGGGGGVSSGCSPIHSSDLSFSHTAVKPVVGMEMASETSSDSQEFAEISDQLEKPDPVADPPGIDDDADHERSCDTVLRPTVSATERMQEERVYQLSSVRHPPGNATMSVRSRSRPGSPVSTLSMNNMRNGLDPYHAKMLVQIERFRYFHISRHGAFVVCMMQPEHTFATTELLTESFADYLGIFSYGPFLRVQISNYLQERYMSVPYGVCLVMLRFPSWKGNQMGGKEKQELEEQLGRGAPLTLVGTVELSFSSRSRAPFPTLNPPVNATYLCNMAIEVEYRGLGLGRELLKAAEQLAVQLGKTEIFLHCRLMDHVPYKLYLRAGYAPVAQDNLFALLMFQRRRCLMRKAFHSPKDGITTQVSTKGR
ncbi:hypothetical protein CBR_g40430 [Chara braunii]|uniref:N-acetyltransferase domain-containing protein n=1 Tax=Chara braunii TaxID=69332 RepID=A0A388LTV6_CHABU|nr:hypothetical protein CBR_g40430 [Chara braunii]|eukprot:GBG85701.1 hypothetical protein CBR_g40430 [Chara braunii]